MITGSGRSPGGGNDNPPQYLCLENRMDRGAWQATVLGVTKQLDTTEQLNHHHNQMALCYINIIIDIGLYILKKNLNSMKRQKYKTLKDELPRLIGAQYTTEGQWKNNSRKNEETEPKQKQHTVVDVTGDEIKVRCCKEQYCIGTWNVRSMNQCKLEVVKKEMARVNVDILEISKLKWTGWVNLTQMTIISTTAGRNPSEEME